MAASTATAGTKVRAVVCPGHSRPVHNLHFSGETPDGTFFISACHDKLPMLRDASTGDWVGTFLGHTGAVWSAKVNAGATRAATGAGDCTARFWNAVNGKELAVMEHPHVVKSVELSGDASRLFTACDDKKLRLFDLSRPATPILTAKLPAAPRSILWTPDEKFLHVAAGTSVHTVDAATGDILKSVEVGGEVRDMDWAAGGTCLAVAAGSTASILDASTLKATASHVLPYGVESIALHPTDPSVFVTGSSDDVWIRTHATADGKELSCLKGHHGPVHVVRFTANGSHYVTGSDDATIRMWPMVGPASA